MWTHSILHSKNSLSRLEETDYDYRYKRRGDIVAFGHEAVPV